MKVMKIDLFPHFKQKICDYCPEIGLLCAPIIAGGFIRDLVNKESPKDMDIFFHSEWDLELSAKVLSRGGWDEVANTENAITFRKMRKISDDPFEDCEMALFGRSTVQLIKFIYGTPAGIVDSFDFTCVMSAVDWANGLIYEDRSFLGCALEKKLVYNNESKPLQSLRRVARFTARGYRISPQELLRIAASCGTITIDDVMAADDY